MKKKFSTLELFCITDGRLSDTINDVYNILNHVCDTELMTHHLPVAFSYLKIKNPKWFQIEVDRLSVLRSRCQSNTFETLIGYIKDKGNDIVEIPQLKDEFDTSDFWSFMTENSLFNK